MASFIRSAPRALSRVAAQQPLAARSRAAPFLFRRGLASSAEQPRLRLGSVAPNFQAKTTQGEIDFHQWIGDSWAILFSHPADFTPVCTTELGAFAKLKNEFEKRGVKMIGLSANDIGSHGKWIEDINEISNTNLSFPIIGDHDRNVAFLYDMITQDDLDNAGRDVAFTIRSVFIIDPSKKIRLTMMYPASTGRNSKEVLRVIDSLQLGDAQKITTPIDWQIGDDVIVPPSVSTADAKKRFGESNVREVKPYLREAAKFIGMDTMTVMNHAMSDEVFDEKYKVRFTTLEGFQENFKVDNARKFSNPVKVYEKGLSGPSSGMSGPLSWEGFQHICTFLSPRKAQKFLGMSIKNIQKYQMSNAIWKNKYKLKKGAS